MEFKSEAKVFRVQIYVDVVAVDRQDAVSGAIEAWKNGGDVGERVEVQAEKMPQSWMAYGNDAIRS